MLNIFPPAIQIIIFYSPVIITILLLAYAINILLNKGVKAVNASSYAWIGASLTIILFLYVRDQFEGLPSWSYFFIIPGIFVMNYISYTQLKKSKKSPKK